MVSTTPLWKRAGLTHLLQDLYATYYKPMRDFYQKFPFEDEWPH
jgi:hypothetical protein